MPARRIRDDTAAAGTGPPCGGGACSRSFGRDRDGVIALEFALVLPLLLLFCFVTVEVGRFALLQMKLEHLASVVGDLASRDRTLDVATVDDIIAVADHVLAPFRFDGNGVVVLSGVGAPDGGAPSVLWQRRGGTGESGDAVAGIDATVILPAGLTAQDGQTLVLAEVVYTYEPWLLGALAARQMVERAYFRPRLGSLDRLLP